MLDDVIICLEFIKQRNQLNHVLGSPHVGQDCAAVSSVITEAPEPSDSPDLLIHLMQNNRQLTLGFPVCL